MIEIRNKQGDLLVSVDAKTLAGANLRSAKLDGANLSPRLSGSCLMTSSVMLTWTNGNRKSRPGSKRSPIFWNSWYRHQKRGLN